jgi:hypothetical protein
VGAALVAPESAGRMGAHGGRRRHLNALDDGHVLDRMTAIGPNEFRHYGSESVTQFWNRTAGVNRSHRPACQRRRVHWRNGIVFQAPGMLLTQPLRPSGLDRGLQRQVNAAG